MSDKCKGKKSLGPPSWKWVHSPIGPLLLRSHDSLATGIFLKDQQYFPADAPAMELSSDRADSSDVLSQLEIELREFFSGSRTAFQTNTYLIGTDFQRAVWQSLTRIPFGSTTTYGHIAALVGKANASRAVGAAIGKNPLSILIPCHRVIGKSGSLTGYAGGIDKKTWLLNRERELIGGVQ